MSIFVFAMLIFSQAVKVNPIMDHFDETQQSMSLIGR